MLVDVVSLPKDLTEAHVRGRAVVVFDVLRATTTMTAALAAGADEIHVFPTLDEARAAANTCKTDRLLCGEVRCLPPEGFDLGNSPGAYVSDNVRGKKLFMSTTNGTRAIVAARNAARLFVGALVNAPAVAEVVAGAGLDLTLLCAGTDGALADEDMAGAGAVIAELMRIRDDVHLESNMARTAVGVFRDIREELRLFLRGSHGGQNIIAAGLAEDIDFAARLNVFDVVGEVDPRNLIVRASLS